MFFHIQEKHKSSQNSGRKNHLKCNICGSQFLYKPSLDEHIENQHRGIKPVCDICDKSFNTKSSFDYHVEAYHRGKTVVSKCEKCDKAYFGRSSNMPNIEAVNTSWRCRLKKVQNQLSKSHISVTLRVLLRIQLAHN